MFECIEIVNQRKGEAPTASDALPTPDCYPLSERKELLIKPSVSVFGTILQIHQGQCKLLTAILDGFGALCGFSNNEAEASASEY